MVTLRTRQRHSLGFTFIGILIVVALSGIALSGVGIVWQQTIQREKEKELLFIGEQYRSAISSYYESTPNGVKQYPRKLEDLLLDNRYPVIKRHLRRLYEDPMRSKQPWGLIKQQEYIVGIHSLSEQPTIKKTGFPVIYESFAEASSYADWKFVSVNN